MNGREGLGWLSRSVYYSRGLGGGEMGIGCRVIVVVQRTGHLSVMRVWAGVGVIVPIQGKRYRGWPEFFEDVRDVDFGIAWHVVPSASMLSGYHGWEGSIH